MLRALLTAYFRIAGSCRQQCPCVHTSQHTYKDTHLWTPACAQRGEQPCVFSPKMRQLHKGPWSRRRKASWNCYPHNNSHSPERPSVFVSIVVRLDHPSLSMTICTCYPSWPGLRLPRSFSLLAALMMGERDEGETV